MGGWGRAWVEGEIVQWPASTPLPAIDDDFDVIGIGAPAEMPAGEAVMAMAVEVEQCRVVVRRAVGFVHMRVVVPSPRFNIHAVSRDAFVGPNPSEKGAGGVDAGETIISLEGGAHTLGDMCIERMARRA